MKLIDSKAYAYGSYVNILKFKRRSLIELSFEETCYNSFPSVLIQVGPSDVFYLSLGLVRFIISVTVWGRHYD